MNQATYVRYVLVKLAKSVHELPQIPFYGGFFEK